MNKVSFLNQTFGQNVFEVRLISPDKRQFSVYHELHIFNTYGTLASTGRRSKKKQPAPNLKHEYQQKNKFVMLHVYVFCPKMFPSFLITKALIYL